MLELNNVEVVYSDVIQVLRGEDAPEASEIQARLDARGLEGDVTLGGQPLYPLLLSAE